jgi:5-oxoprolinase (ATP-hydrolysing)
MVQQLSLMRTGLAHLLFLHCLIHILDDVLNSSTILVEPDCRAEITDDGNVRIAIGVAKQEGRKRAAIGTDVDPIQLSIFSHRFMSIAEQMGRILQRTSISTNIKVYLNPHLLLTSIEMHLKMMQTFETRRLLC